MVNKNKKSLGEKFSEFKNKVKKKTKLFLKDLKVKFTALFFFFFVGFLLWALSRVIFYFYGFSVVEWIKTIPYLYPLFVHFVNEIKLRTPLGIGYLFMFSSLFFLPIPLEPLYFGVLGQGGVFIVTLATVTGLIAGQFLNYMFGRFFGFLFLRFIKKKTQKSIKEKLKKYGGVAIFFSHIIPFPFQLINFFCGVLRYKFLKWLLIVIIATIIKHIIMYGIYVRYF